MPPQLLVACEEADITPPLGGSMPGYFRDRQATLLPRSDGFTSDAEKIYPGFYQGTVDEKWVGEFVDRTARAVVRAMGRAAPEKRLMLHEGEENTIAHYRRYLMKDGSVRTNPGRGEIAFKSPPPATE